MREEEEKRGGEDGASVYASCGSALRRRPVDKLDWKLCGRCTHIHKHTHRLCAPLKLAAAVISSRLRRVSRPASVAVVCTCGPGRNAANAASCVYSACRLALQVFHRPRRCLRRRLSCAPSHTHTARSQHCLLTQEVLFIRQIDRDLWGARQRAHSKRRLCQASEDE